MQVLSNLQFESSGLALDFLNTFPANPFEGKLALVDGMIYVFTTIKNIETWYPLTNQINNFVHTQGINATTWVIDHNLNSSNFTYFAFDKSNNLITGTFNKVNENQFTLTFPNAQSGRAILFYDADHYSKTDVDVLLDAKADLSEVSIIASNSLGSLLHIQDQKPSGTNGGTLTASTWNKRTLNTILTNNITGSSLSNNAITLPAGTYYAEGFSVGTAVNKHKVKLQNTSNNTVLLHGSSENDSVTSFSTVSGKFILASTSNLEMQHYCTTTKASSGQD